MAILEILTVPDPRLKTIAEPVAKVDDEVYQLMDDMLETMYAAPGIGLAATQVNVHRRIVVMDVSDNHDQPLCFINPEIVSCEGSVVYEEGCLSVPGIYDGVERAESIVVKALDRQGKPFTMEAEGLLAICIQHEIDHLNGKVFIEYLSYLKQQRIKKKLEKMGKR